MPLPHPPPFPPPGACLYPCFVLWAKEMARAFSSGDHRLGCPYLGGHWHQNYVEYLDSCPQWPFLPFDLLDSSSLHF